MTGATGVDAADIDHADRRPTLLFDDSCPMCRVYTSAFERLGWASRSALGRCDDAVLERLDVDRARHEIPMIDTNSGEVRYGLDALTTVIGDHSATLGAIMRWPPTRAVALPLYWLISYNRREVAGCPPPTTGFDCAPDFHRGWTGAYLALAGAAMGVTARSAGAAAGVTLVAAATTFGETLREARQDDRLRIAAHAATAGLTACAAAMGVRAGGASSGFATAVGAATGLHQLWRRRHLRGTPRAAHRLAGPLERVTRS